MKKIFTIFASGAAVAALIIALFLIGPILALWVINSLAESGGSSFYVEHNMRNYFTALIFLLLVRS